MANPSDPLIGQTLAGKYRLDERLGGGGMGATYKAFRVRLGDYAVVKVMHGHLTNDPAFGERFSREAQAAAQRVPRRSETERPRVRGNGRRGNAERHLAA